MKTRNLLLAGVSALAIVAVANAGTANATCGGGQCTSTNSVVTGTASARGAAFEKAGIAAVGTGNVQVGVVSAAGSHSVANLTKNSDCTSGCISGTATTQNYAGYAAQGTGDFVISGGIAGTHGETGVSLNSVANNGEGETGLATVNTGSKAGTLVGSVDVGNGNGAVFGDAYTGAGSVAEVCATALDNVSTAYTMGDSAYSNDGSATGDVTGAGSFGLTHTETLAVTTAADAAVVNTQCLLGQCDSSTPLAGFVATGGLVTSASGAGSLDGDLAFNGTAETGSAGYSVGGSTLASSVSLDKTYGKIGEGWTFGWVGPKLYNLGWSSYDINGVNGLTGDANTDATVYAGAGATGDLVGAYALEGKTVESSVKILTTDF